MSQDLKQKAEGLVDSLEMPESIRTPGRTWTKYPDLEIEDVEKVEPEIEAEGDVEVLTGSEAVEEAGEKLMDAIKVEEDKLTAIHAANMNSVIYVRAKGKGSVEISYDEDSPVFAHLVVETDTSAELDLTESFSGSPEIRTSFNEFYLGKNSTLRYGAIEASEGELNYSRRKAVLGRDARVEWLNGIFEGELSRTQIETVLKGDNSSVEKTGVWYPTEEEHFDISLQVKHIGDGTKCDMDSRAVVDDSSRSVYEGLQKVGDPADSTKSFQDETVLMLSDEAEVDASPKLMIENPDVEASHAASAGKIDEKKQHYMESRGLTEEKARKLVVKGFFEPVMEEIELPELKERVREQVQKKLRR